MKNTEIMEIYIKNALLSLKQAKFSHQKAWQSTTSDSERLALNIQGQLLADSVEKLEALADILSDNNT